jgi:predicted 3-demethylubiquinone-9 3-methyltransferase (glyoxalase superfamily)
MQKIMPCLWFDTQAEHAVKFYTSVFSDSEILKTSYYGEAGPGQPSSVMVITFQLDGQEYMALNGGPEYKFTPAISLYINCDTQAEVDYFWEKLSEGGEKGPCGWLTDQYGVSWQVVPVILGELIADKDPEKVNRVMRVMLQMGKLDIAQLKAAYEQS